MIAATIVVIGLLAGGTALLVLAASSVRAGRRMRGSASGLLGSLLLLVGANAAPGLPLVGPGLQHGAYRSARCGAGSAAQARRSVDPRTGAEPTGSTPCDVELVANDGIAPSAGRVVGSDACWRPISAETPEAPSCYSLATIEFSDRGKLFDGGQMRDLRLHLRSLRKVLAARAEGLPPARRIGVEPAVYMIVYVHGWRHDARAGDGNLRRFRGMVAAAARDVAARCAITGRRCGTAVVGLYASWRGAVGLWDRDSDVERLGLLDRLAVALNVLTFPGRKAVSDGLGPTVVTTLIEVRRDMDGVFPGGGSRMLLVGHSLGGNLLLSGVPRFAGDARLGLPGDLTVLFNPATETSKWEDLWDDVHRRRWSATTPPRLVSIVSPPRYFETAGLASVDERGRPLRSRERERLMRQVWRESASSYDTVVDGAFRYSQMVSVRPGRGCGYDRRIYGLSHLLYGTSSCGDDRMRRYSSHFLEVNPSSNAVRSSLDYWASRDGRRSCFVEPAFLYCARARGNGGSGRCAAMPASIGSRGAWDFRSLAKKTLGRTMNRFMDPSDPERPGSGGAAPRGCFVTRDGVPTDVPSLWQQESVQLGTGWHTGGRGHAAEAFGPMWAVRALPISLRGHSGFWTAPVACLLNKLVLDDPLAIERPGERDPDAFARPIGMTAFASTLRPACARLFAGR